MRIFLLTAGVLVLCAAGLGISLFFRRRPLDKRCSSDPDQECHCRENDCGDAGRES